MNIPGVDPVRAVRMMRMPPNTPLDQVFTPNEMAANPHLAQGTVGDLIQSQGGPEPSEALTRSDIKAFIVHHTGGRGTPEGVQSTLRQRGLGVEYIMDRDGNIIEAGGRGSSHMMTGWGQGQGLGNHNTVGMEVIARDNNDVTPAQIAAGKAFIDRHYSGVPVYGHGEVNPGHKEADEGMGIVNAVRSGRTAPDLAEFGTPVEGNSLSKSDNKLPEPVDLSQYGTVASQGPDLPPGNLKVASLDNSSPSTQTTRSDSDPNPDASSDDIDNIDATPAPLAPMEKRPPDLSAQGAPA